MARVHKYMWAGADIQTALGPDQIRLAVLETVAECKGRTELTADTPLLLGLDISRLKGTIKLAARGSASWMTFDVQISDEAGGRRAVRTHIIRALLSDSSIPFGPKKMNAYDAYLDFVRAVAAKVSAADPTADVGLRQGPMPPGYALDGLDRRVGAPALRG